LKKKRYLFNFLNLKSCKSLRNKFHEYSHFGDTVQKLRIKNSRSTLIVGIQFSVSLFTMSWSMIYEKRRLPCILIMKCFFRLVTLKILSSFVIRFYAILRLFLFIMVRCCHWCTSWIFNTTETANAQASTVFHQSVFFRLLTMKIPHGNLHLKWSKIKTKLERMGYFL
jgi:hypothetical protein